MYLKENLNYTSLKNISNETLKRHYEIYLKYLERLNNLVDSKYSKIDLIKNISDYPLNKRNDILFNVGGVLNHELYFKILGGNGIPNKEFLKIIENSFGSFENFKNKLKESAKILVGSGYVFVVIKNKKLDIVILSNQDNPYMYDSTPIMALDLWEHAYYLDYYTKEDYFNNLLDNIDYDKVYQIYKESI